MLQRLVFSRKKSPNKKLPCKVAPYMTKQLRTNVHNFSKNIVYRSPSQADAYRKEILKSLSKALVRQHSISKSYSQRFSDKVITETCPYIEISLGQMFSLL